MTLTKAQKQQFKKALKAPCTQRDLRQIHEWCIDYKQEITLAINVIRKYKQLARDSRQSLHML